MVTPDANAEAIAIGVGLLAALGKWLYAKLTQPKAPDLKTLLDETITAELGDALDDGETLGTIEQRLTAAIGTLALKVNVKLPEVMVRIAVQAAILKFRTLLKEREAQQKAARELPAKADELRVLADAIATKLATLSPDVAIDTITEAKAAGVELLEVR